MIPKVIFQFSKEDDLWNIWDICNSKGSYGKSWKDAVTKNMHEICDDKKYEECEKELLESMKDIHKNKLLDKTANLFSQAWEGISQEYFYRLEKIMKSPFYTKKINAHLTTADRCPYDPDHNPPSFFVNFFWGVPSALQTAGHELMHIQFHNSKYWKICEKEIGKEKTFDLKEALTVLLNLEFKDLWIMRDMGYPNHTQLRKYIAREWKKEKDFDSLIDKSIKWIKKNGIK
ncbi:MAG: hypothetical protein WC511_00405 [Candidatus Pacearchaeota archaeon]